MSSRAVPSSALGAEALALELAPQPMVVAVRHFVVDVDDASMMIPRFNSLAVPFLPRSHARPFGDY